MKVYSVFLRELDGGMSFERLVSIHKHADTATNKAIAEYEKQFKREPEISTHVSREGELTIYVGLQETYEFEFLIRVETVEE
jgi:hypothetical protein